MWLFDSERYQFDHRTLPLYIYLIFYKPKWFNFFTCENKGDTCVVFITILFSMFYSRLYFLTNNF